ncbi:hypothetical protein [Candidatus Frankia nodulisporulans]|uniref:hypothetical protein n=1 Tax=Candidatus Frankia nodulisporulans TaxID=2060052 RepID=UPI0013D70E37|nr:hypothetical protein [Candidatus Frankia nodulisporulans]
MTATATWTCCGHTATYPTALTAATAAHHCRPTVSPPTPAPVTPVVEPWPAPAGPALTATPAETPPAAPAPAPTMPSSESQPPRPRWQPASAAPSRRRPWVAVTGGTAAGTLAQIGA